MNIFEKWFGWGEDDKKDAPVNKTAENEAAMSKIVDKYPDLAGTPYEKASIEYRKRGMAEELGLPLDTPLNTVSAAYEKYYIKKKLPEKLCILAGTSLESNEEVQAEVLQAILSDELRAEKDEIDVIVSELRARKESEGSLLDPSSRRLELYGIFQSKITKAIFDIENAKKIDEMIDIILNLRKARPVGYYSHPDTRESEKISDLI